jgi:hypothetical protein
MGSNKAKEETAKSEIHPDGEQTSFVFPNLENIKVTAGTQPRCNLKHNWGQLPVFASEALCSPGIWFNPVYLGFIIRT